MSRSEKTGDQLPLQGLTRDGWSNEDEATATCACGAVQMVVVSPPSCHAIWGDSRPHPASHHRTFVADCNGGIGHKYAPNHIASQSARACQHLCLPLRRLPQGIRLHVRYQHDDPRLAHPLHSRRRQPDHLCPEPNYHDQSQNDKRLLQDVRHHYVARWRGGTGNEVHAGWAGG